MTDRSAALAGRRVVVTRAVEQSEGVADLLRDRGAIPVMVPLVEIVEEPAGTERLAELHPADFDWLVVTSPNGAHHYARAHSLAPKLVAAVGTATAAALREHDVSVTLVPAVQRADGLVSVFPAPSAQPATALVVQAFDAEPTLAEGLTALGWAVTVVAPYRSVASLPTAGEQLAALSADAVLFASGSAVRSWVEVFGDATPPVIVAIGPRTAAVAGGLGLKVSTVAADHSLKGLVAALERHLDPHIDENLDDKLDGGV
jgi:uroporphyrinogen-III synthase